MEGNYLSTRREISLLPVNLKDNRQNPGNYTLSTFFWANFLKGRKTQAEGHSSLRHQNKSNGSIFEVRISYILLIIL